MPENCFYCERGEKQKSLMLEICELLVSRVYLFRNQFFRGRCVVAHREHKRELYKLSASELAAFMGDVTRVAKVLGDLYAPDKINYAIYGDTVDHLHFHVVPKYANEGEWGQPFSRNPDAIKMLSQAEYEERIAEIRAHLI